MHAGPEFESQALWHTPVTPVLGRQSHEDPWDSPATKSRVINKFQARERP